MVLAYGTLQPFEAPHIKDFWEKSTRITFGPQLASEIELKNYWWSISIGNTAATSSLVEYFTIHARAVVAATDDAVVDIFYDCLDYYLLS